MKIVHFLGTKEDQIKNSEDFKNLVMYQIEIGYQVSIVSNVFSKFWFIIKGLIFRSYPHFIHIYEESFVRRLLPKDKVVVTFLNFVNPTSTEEANYPNKKLYDLMRDSVLVISNTNNILKGDYDSELVKFSDLGSKVFAIENSVSKKTYYPVENKQLALNSNVVAIADITKNEVITDLIDSMRYLPGDYLLKVYYYNDNKDREELVDSYIGIAQNFNLSSRIEFNVIPDLEEDLISMVQSASVGIVCVDPSNFSIKFLASGVPVISNSPLLVLNGFFHLKSFAPKNLANRIKSLTLEEGSVIDMDVIDSFYSWESRIKRLDKTYKNLTRLNEKK